MKKIRFSFIAFVLLLLILPAYRMETLACETVTVRSLASGSNSLKASISGQNTPGTLKQGENFSIYGTISSSTKLTYVSVGVYNASGSRQIGKTVSPGSTSYNINNLDSYIQFDQLTAGVYYYRITATNSAGIELLVNNPFIVLNVRRSLENGIYSITSSVNSGYGLSVAGHSDAYGANVTLGAANASNYEKFEIAHRGAGYYLIKNVGSGKFLVAAGGSGLSGTNVQMYAGTEPNITYLLWQILPDGSGSYYLVPHIGTSCCLDLTSGSAVNGQNVRILTPDLSNAQRWYLTETSAVTNSGTTSTTTSGTTTATTTLNSSSATLYTGMSLQLKATVTGKSSKVTWSTSNKKIATVNSSGKVTAKKAGEVAITAKANGKTAKCTVTVKNPSTTLNKKTSTVYVGKTLKLTATVKGKSSKVTWKSNNKKIATVNSSGKVTAKKAGKVTITAKANGKTAKCTITVKNPSITLNTKKSTLYVGDTLQLNATVKGASSKVTWKTSNSKYATVSSSGKVVAKTAGTVTITAKANGKTAKCTVTIKKKALPKLTLEQAQEAMHNYLYDTKCMDAVYKYHGGYCYNKMQGDAYVFIFRSYTGAYANIYLYASTGKIYEEWRNPFIYEELVYEEKKYVANAYDYL